MALRVMTMNYCRGQADPAAVEDLLARFQPDVVAAQELGPEHAGVLERHFGHGVLKPEHGGEGKGLVSLHPMPVAVLELPDRDGLVGSFDNGFAAVEVVGVHLLNPIDGWLRRAPRPGPQVAALADWLACSRRRRILLGDMNAAPGWAPYRTLSSQLDDAVAEHHRSAGTRPTSTWSYHDRGWPRLRIDHVWAAGFNAVAVGVEPIGGSDHRALWADLVEVEHGV